MAAKIFIAENLLSGKREHIDIVPFGSTDIFRCLKCSQQLIKVKTLARKKDWHFRHGIESNCDGAKDRALHDLAVQLILDNSLIVISDKISITYSNQRKEVSLGPYRSDATVTTENIDVHFEVFVKNDLIQRKISYYKSEKIKCIKIDLSNRKFLQKSFDEIKFQVLHEISNRVIIYWEESEKSTETSKPSTDPDNTGCFLGFIFFAFIVNLGFKSHDKKISWPKRRKRG